MSKIQDEFSERTEMSKQRRYQLRRLRDGKCIFCGRAAVITGKCEAHRRKFNIKDREKMRRRTGAKRRNTKAESYSFDIQAKGKPPRRMVDRT